MKRSEKVRRIVCYVVALAFLIFLCVSCGTVLRHWGDPVWILNDRWQLSPALPAESELIFYASDQGFTGDGRVQYVFAFSSEPTEFLSGFSAERDAAAEQFMTSAAWTNEDGDFSPDWEETYLWEHLEQSPYTTDGEAVHYFEEMYVVYFPSQLWLYVLEDLT